MVGHIVCGKCNKETECSGVALLCCTCLTKLEAKQPNKSTLGLAQDLQKSVLFDTLNTYTDLSPIDKQSYKLINEYLNGVIDLLNKLKA